MRGRGPVVNRMRAGVGGGGGGGAAAAGAHPLREGKARVGGEVDGVGGLAVLHLLLQPPVRCRIQVVESAHAPPPQLSAGAKLPL